MRKLLLILFLLPIISFSQDLPARRVRTDTIKAFSTNYGSLDTMWIKSRTDFTRPARFDSLVSFGVRIDSAYLTTAIPYLDKSNTFTGTPQIFSATRQDTISSNTPSGNVVVNDSLSVTGKTAVKYITADSMAIGIGTPSAVSKFTIYSGKDTALIRLRNSTNDTTVFTLTNRTSILTQFLTIGDAN